MSKEFDAWWVDGHDRWPDEKNTARDAFTAGRALGRREMKGEAKEACEARAQMDNALQRMTTVMAEARSCKAAIEAIPEEV